MNEAQEDVRTVIRRRLEETLPVAKRYREQADANEQYASGIQTARIIRTGGGERLIELDAWPIDLPRMWQNVCGPLLGSWCALLCGDLPTATARPASDEPADFYRADVAAKILEYLRGKLHTAEKVNKTVRAGGVAGTAGLRAGIDPETQELRLDVLTIHDYVFEPQYDYREAAWVIFTSWLTKDEAKRRLASAGLTAAPQTEKRVNAVGEEHSGVRFTELFEKPSEDLPRGRYVAMVGEEVTQEIDNPYYFVIKGVETWILPFFIMKIRDQRDSSYGVTPFSDLIPLQFCLNETVSRTVKNMRMSAPQLVLPKSLAAGFDPLTHNTVAIPDDMFKDLAPGVKWTSPVPVDPQLAANITFFTNAMLTTIGLNDTTAGTAQRGQSGLAIDNLEALDKQKNADATSSMKAMLLDCFRFCLLCVAAVYPDEKKQAIAYATKAAVDAFDESDFDGIDIVMQLVSENADKAAQNARRGMVGTQEAREIVNAFLAGQDVLQDPTIVDFPSLFAAIEEAKALSLAAGDVSEHSALLALEAQARLMAPPDATGAATPNPTGAPPQDPDAVQPGALADPTGA